MEADRTETKDLASKEPARVKAMAKLHEAWAKKVGVVEWGELTKKKK